MLVLCFKIIGKISEGEVAALVEVDLAQVLSYCD